MSVIFHKNGIDHDTEVCLRGLNLLGHAQILELHIGSTCGGHGKCGADRLVLGQEDQARVNSPTAIELAHLGPEKIAAGVRLGCQVFPNEDGLSIRATIE
jgi:ferredoxin